MFKYDSLVGQLTIPFLAHCFAVFPVIGMLKYDSLVGQLTIPFLRFAMHKQKAKQTKYNKSDTNLLYFFP